MLFPKHAGLIPLVVLCLLAPAAAKPHASKPHASKPHAPVPTGPLARREIQALYNHMNAEAMQRNVDGLYEYDSDDYTLLDAKGHAHDPSDGRQELESVLDKVDKIQIATTITGFEGTDTEATVTLKDRFLVGMANNSNGRAFKFTASDTARDHWIRTDDGWRRTRTRVLSGSHALKKNF